MTPIDLTPAPGRYPFPLSPRWTAVVIEPLPGIFAVALFLDGEPVEVIEESDDVLGYLRALSADRRASRRSSSFGTARLARTRDCASRASSAVSPDHPSATS